TSGRWPSGSSPWGWRGWSGSSAGSRCGGSTSACSASSPWRANPWTRGSDRPPGRSGRKEGAVEKVNLRDKLALFHDHWNPKVVGDLNGQQVKLVKFRGEFVWHHHDHEDE